MADAPDVSFIIVSFNTRQLLAECLRTIMALCGRVKQETFVVDCNSNDGSPELVSHEFPWVKLLRSERNLGFANANNLAFPHCRARYVVLLNSDAFLTQHALERSVAHMDGAPGVGLGGAQLVGRDGVWQPSARLFPSLLNDFLSLSGLSAKYPRSPFFGRADRTWADPEQAAAVDWVPGAYAIIRRDVLERVGYFDPRFFLYYEEVDLCRRIKAAGYEIWYWPDSQVIHLGGESSKTVSHLSLSSSGAQLTLWRMRSALLYYRKHHGIQVWAAKAIEQVWHLLRAWKSRAPFRRHKREESLAIVTLLDRAWMDTHGGYESPTQPW